MNDDLQERLEVGGGERGEGWRRRGVGVWGGGGATGWGEEERIITLNYTLS